MNLNSVERIVEYLDLPQEPPATVESNRVPAYWPSSATEQLLSVENICIRYAPELPPVLQDVSFKLRSKERVGLLGRTGSGKSTLAMALLRFVDPSSGKIVVDGIDISKIGLHDLRSRVVSGTESQLGNFFLTSVPDNRTAGCDSVFGHHSVCVFFQLASDYFLTFLSGY